MMFSLHIYNQNDENTHDPDIYSDSSRWTWKGFAWSGLRKVATFYSKLNVPFGSSYLV